MAITEAYMDAGDFTLTMKTATPHLMSTIRESGWIVITPQDVGDPALYSIASLLDSARYTGIVVDVAWDDRVLTLEGVGLDSFLGDRQGVGWPSPAVGYMNSPLTTIIAAIGSGGIIPPIFTIGDVTNTGTGHTGTHTAAETVKDVITAAMADCAGHYRIKPNHTINAGPVGTDAVYRATPNTVFLADGWGADALWHGLPVQGLTTRVTMREWLSNVLPPLYGLLGGQITRVNTGDLEPVGGIATTMAIRTSVTQVSGGGAGVGDVVYIHQHGNGLSGPDAIEFRGELLDPVAHRIQEAAWDLTDGMGLYYFPNKSVLTPSDGINLSPYANTTPSHKTSTFLRTLDVSLEAPSCS
jgi:hypothetical protein